VNLADITKTALAATPFRGQLGSPGSHKDLPKDFQRLTPIMQSAWRGAGIRQVAMPGDLFAAQPVAGRP